MYLLDLDKINISHIKTILEQIPTEERAIEIKGCLDDLKNFRSIILLLGLSAIDTLKLSITTSSTSKYYRLGLNRLTANIKTLYLSDTILVNILDNTNHLAYAQIKLRLENLEQLIVIDADNHHLNYVGSEAIAALLNHTQESQKSYFKPDINLLQSPLSLAPHDINKLIATIPDEQTVLDLSGIDITTIPLFTCEAQLFSKLPARIHTLNIAQTNFQSLYVSDFAYFSQFLQKFTTIYLNLTDIELLFKKDDALTVRQKIVHLIEGTANANVHVQQRDNTVISYTSHDFKKELQRRDPVFQQQQQALAAVEQVRQRSHARTQNAATLVSAQRQQVIEQLQQEVLHFRAAGQSCFGLNNLKKAARLQQALNRAENINTTIEDFLTYRENGAESILDALAYHRIGFFGKPNSLARIEAYVDNLRLGSH